MFLPMPSSRPLRGCSLALEGACAAWPTQPPEDRNRRQDLPRRPDSPAMRSVFHPEAGPTRRRRTACSEPFPVVGPASVVITTSVVVGGIHDYVTRVDVISDRVFQPVFRPVLRPVFCKETPRNLCIGLQPVLQFLESILHKL